MSFRQRKTVHNTINTSTRSNSKMWGRENPNLHQANVIQSQIGKMGHFKKIAQSF